MPKAREIKQAMIERHDQLVKNHERLKASLEKEVAISLSAIKTVENSLKLYFNINRYFNG